MDIKFIPADKKEKSYLLVDGHEKTASKIKSLKGDIDTLTALLSIEEDKLKSEQAVILHRFNFHRGTGVSRCFFVDELGGVVKVCMQDRSKKMGKGNSEIFNVIRNSYPDLVIESKEGKVKDIEGLANSLKELGAHKLMKFVEIKESTVLKKGVLPDMWQKVIRKEMTRDDAKIITDNLLYSSQIYTKEGGR